MSNINFEKELNQEQLRVVQEASGPTLVLAGAGSGKTRTIVYRVAYLLEQGVNAASILLLTFTNKAATEMANRVEYLVGRGAKEMWGGTFHSIAARVLRKYAHLIGYKPNFTILDQDDSKNLIKLAVGELGIDPKARRFPAPAVLQSIFSLSRNTKQSISEIIAWKHPSFIKFEQEIQNIFQTYSDRKRANNSMDFDDLLLNFVLLLHTNSAVRESLQTKWKHILVDEYQDTNELQGDFIKLLYNAEDASQSLVVVGDDAQSIYSFRGATVENILRFPKQYPGARIYRLEINYRSTTPILNLANHIIAHNNRQYEKSLRGTIEKGEKPVLVIAPTGTHEGEFIAEKVLELRDEGTPMKRVAVLFRAAYHSEALEFELAKRDIPYEYRGGVRFFERAHIKDLLAFLRVFANAKDEVSWLRILNLQAGIGAVGASKIFSIVGRENTIEEALGASVSQLGSRLGSGWQNMTRVLRELSRGKDSAPAKVIDIVLKNFYAEYLEAEYPDWRERLDDLEQLKVFASTYEDLTQFVGDLSLYENFSVRKDGEAARDEEKIVLSTIHQAKGLEWDVVFIINLANSAFPNRRALLEDQGIEEERRLLYVAVTRARKQLFLSYPLLGEGEAAFLNQPSMFLDEIPQNLFKIIQMQKIDESHDNAEDPFSDSDVPSIDIGKKFSGYLGNY